MTSSISSKGQITVPARVREALGLAAGTKLEIELGPNGTFVGRKVEDQNFFEKFRGIGKDAQVPYRDSHEAMEVLRGEVAEGDVD